MFGKSMPMIRALSIGVVASWAILAPAANACQCALPFSTCNEVGASDLIFIGTVELIEPMFLNRWNPASPESLRSLNDAYTTAREHPSTTALAGLRDAYLKAFPEATADEKHQVDAAKTPSQFASLFYSSLNRGMRIRFRVKTLFKNEDDDDAPPDAASKDKTAKVDDDRKAAIAKNNPDNNRAGKDDKDKKDDDMDFVEVETAFGDCGYDFQQGETYLVYANGDEDSDVMSTTSCSRTRRLSDAGEDLTYLLFYKDRPESARLDGFVTRDELYQTDLDRLHELGAVKAPVPGVIAALQSGTSTRYAETDGQGRFVFDHLDAGDYNLSAFAPGYPARTQLVAGPKAFHVNPKSCVRQVLLAPKENGN